MARKKSRPTPPSPIQPATPGTGRPAPTPGPTDGIRPGPAPLNGSSKITTPGTVVAAAKIVVPKQPDAFVLALRKIANVLGSLQLAVILLSIFAGVVFLNTAMEHWYQTKIAQELGYKAWWFILLLFLLSVNILFAAVKKIQWRRSEDFDPPTMYEVTGQAFSFGVIGITLAYLPTWWPWSSPQHDWSISAGAALAIVLFGLAFGALGVFFSYHPSLWPWKRNQTGFLVTHIGLLTMLFGGVLNALGGTDAVMQVVDSPDREVHAEIRQRFGFDIPRMTGVAIYNDISMVQVSERAKGEERWRLIGEADFEGGALPWTTIPGQEAKADLLLSLMNWIHRPLGHWWSMGLKDGGSLEVLDYIPMARREDFREAKTGPAAFKLQLRTPMVAQPIEDWLGATRNHREMRAVRGMPVIAEFLGQAPGPLLKEFRDPPADPGRKGTLVAYVEGQRVAIPVESNLFPEGQESKLLPVGGGWSVRFTKYSPNFQGNASDPPTNPILEFELHQGNQKEAKLVILARLTGSLLDLEKGAAFPQGLQGRPWFWYHGPDVRQGREMVRGVLQLVQDGEEKLNYRAFGNIPNVGFGVESSGPVVPGGAPTPIWQKMKWTFRVAEYYPHAKEEPRFVPANIAPGKDTEDDRMMYPSAIQCRLTVPGESKAREFWVQLQQGAQTIEVGERQLKVVFTQKTKDLGFELLLERAEQTVDPGTQASATFSSYVRLFDPKLKIEGERREITMNQPLEHRGYRFYQSTYRFLDAWDGAGRPVSLSGFTVGYDPGLELKYAGSILLSVGIIMMFYMKSYFFKPQARKKTPAKSDAETAGAPPTPKPAEPAAAV